MQEKYVPNGVETTFETIISEIFSAGFRVSVKIQIDAATLSVRYVQFLPAVAIDLNQSIAHHQVSDQTSGGQDLYDWQKT